MPVKKTDDTPTEADVWADGDEGDALVLHTVDPNRDMITVSLKGGSGKEAWIVGHFNSVAEAVDVFSDPEWEELIKLTVERGSELQEAYGGSAKPTPRASSGRSNSSWGNKSSNNRSNSRYNDDNKPLVQVEDGEYFCDHGDAVRETGETNGRSWIRWDCPDRECKSVFENKQRNNRR